MRPAPPDAGHSPTGSGATRSIPCASNSRRTASTCPSVYVFVSACFPRRNVLDGARDGAEELLHVARPVGRRSPPCTPHRLPFSFFVLRRIRRPNSSGGLLRSWPIHRPCASSVYRCASVYSRPRCWGTCRSRESRIGLSPHVGDVDRWRGAGFVRRVNNSSCVLRPPA